MLALNPDHNQSCYTAQLCRTPQALDSISSKSADRVGCRCVHCNTVYMSTCQPAGYQHITHRLRSLRLGTMYGRPRCGKFALMLSMEQPSESPFLVPVHSQHQMETDFGDTARAHTCFSMIFQFNTETTTLTFCCQSILLGKKK